MSPPFKEYIVRADLVIGHPDAALHDPVPPENEARPPQPVGGVLDRILDTAPIRQLVGVLDADQRAIRAYPRHFLRRYRELVETHVRTGRETFGFYDRLPLRADVVRSSVHGAAVILTTRHGSSISFRTIKQSIEAYAWPETTVPLVGNPTTLEVARHETVVFLRGHRIRARGGPTVCIAGTLIYDGRMILKAGNSRDAWSEAVARLDALLAFLREARGRVADYAKLHRDAVGERLLIVGQEIAEMERSGAFRSDPGSYLERSEEYFDLVRESGFEGIEGMPLLEAIRRSVTTVSAGPEMVKEAGKAVLGDGVKIGLTFVLGTTVFGSLTSNPLFGVLLGMVSALIVWAVFRPKRS